MLAISSVYPSGLERTAARVPRFVLAPGDSLYFDSSVGHVYISVGEADAEVLVCCVDTDDERPPGAI